MEYFKYKAQTDFLDSGKLTGDLVSAVSGITERKKKASEEVQKQFDDVQSELNNWQATKTTDLNELAIKGVDEIRQKNKELADKYNRGEISSAQYKVATTNLKQNWTAWAKGAQNFDSQLQALIERQNNGEGGEAEAAQIRYLAEYGNLINKSWNVNTDGNILLVEKDKNGNVIRFDDSKFIFNPGNNISVKVNLDKDLDKDISYWQTWKLTNKKPDGTEYSLEDMRQNPAFQNAAVSLQNKFTATPQQTASVLADNGEHQIAINDAEANRFLDEMVSKEQQRREYAGLQPMSVEAINEFKEQSAGKIIVMKRDKSGQMIPDITPEQLKEARKIINDKIEMNLGRVEVKDDVTLAAEAEKARASKYPPSSRGSKSTKKEDIALNAYIASVDAVTKGNFEPFDQENYSYKSLTDKNGKKYVEIQPLIKQTVRGIVQIVPKGKPIKVYRPDAMTSYLKDVKGANLKMYHSGKDDYLKQYGDYYYEEPSNKKTSGSTPKKTGNKPKFN